MRSRRAQVVGLILVLAAAAALTLWWSAGRRASRPASGSAAASGDDAVERGAPSPTASDPRRLAPAEIRGTVRERGGGPLAGAEVCSRWSAEGLASEDVREPACVTTDATGVYRLAGLVPGHHALLVSAVGHVPQALRPEDDDDLTLVAAEVREGVDFALAPGGVEVSGVVSDISGGPIADARVWGGATGEWRFATTTRADGAGRFTLWLAPGTVRLAAEAEGYADGEIEAVAPARAAQILLTPASSLTGVVVEAGTGAPVAGATVSVASDDESAEVTATARTGADGRFVLERLAPGRYKPHASGRGVYGEPAESVLLGLGQRVDVVIEVHPARIVRGRIEIDEAGRRTPCTRGWIGLSADRGPSMWGETDPRGAIELVSVRPGAYDVSVTCEGYLAADDYAPVIVDARDVDGLVWTVGPGGSVRGVVRTSAGAPVAGVDVSAQLTSPGMEWSWSGGRSGDDGAFLITGLAPGEYELEVWSSEHHTAEPQPRVKVVIGVEARADVVVADTGTVTGLVVDSDGRALPDLAIEIMADEGGARLGGSRTGEDGRFVARAVRPGEGWVIASRAGTERLKPVGARSGHGEKVVVAAGQTVDVRLVVEARSRTITGTVRDARGQAVVDAWVVATRESEEAGEGRRGARVDDGGRSIVTDETGAFTVGEIAAGRYTVRAFRRGGGEAIAEHVADGSAIALVIAATGSIAGTVTTSSGTVPDELAVAVVDRETGFERGESFYRTGGAFTMRDLPAGAWSVTVSTATGRASQDVAIAAGEQRSGLAFRIVDDVTVRGRLVDAVTDAPVPGVRIEIGSAAHEDVAMRFGLEDGVEAFSDAQGRFEVGGVAPGPSYVTAVLIEDGEPMGLVEHVVDVRPGARLVDVGDVPVLRRRTRPGERAGYLGLEYAQVAAGTRAEAREVKVAAVAAGGPAAAAGLQVGDVVVAVDGHHVRGPLAYLAWWLTPVPVGTTVRLGLARGVTVAVTAVARPAPP